MEPSAFVNSIKLLELLSDYQLRDDGTDVQYLFTGRSYVYFRDTSGTTKQSFAVMFVKLAVVRKHAVRYLLRLFNEVLCTAGSMKVPTNRVSFAHFKTVFEFTGCSDAQANANLGGCQRCSDE